MLTAIFILLCLLSAGNAAVLMLLMRGAEDSAFKAGGGASGGNAATAAGAANTGAVNGHAEAAGTYADADEDRAEKAFLESLSSLLGYNIDTAREAVRR